MITVTIKVRRSRRAPDDGLGEISQTSRVDVSKTPHLVDSSKDLGPLTILLSLLNTRNLWFDVPVDLEEIRQTVEVEIQEKRAEGQRRASGETDATDRGFIPKTDPISLSIQRRGFVREIPHRDQKFTGGGIAGGIKPHRSGRIAIKIECDAETGGILLEETGSIVQKETVGSGVVRDQDVGVTIPLDVDQQEPQCLHHRHPTIGASNPQSTRPGLIDETAVSVIDQKTKIGPGETGGRTVALPMPSSVKSTCRSISGDHST